MLFKEIKYLDRLDLCSCVIVCVREKERGGWREREREKKAIRMYYFFFIVYGSVVNRAKTFFALQISRQRIRTQSHNGRTGIYFFARLMKESRSRRLRYYLTLCKFIVSLYTRTLTYVFSLACTEYISHQGTILEYTNNRTIF